MNSKRKIKTVKEMLEDMNLAKYQKHSHFHILNVANHIDEISLYSDIVSEGVFEINYGANFDFMISIGNQSYETKESYLSFLAPGQNFHIDATKKELNKEGFVFVVLFSVDFLYFFGPSNFSLIKKFPFFNRHYSPVYYVNHEFERLMHKYYSIMYAEFQKMDDNNIEIIRSYLIILLYEINRRIGDNGLKSAKTNRAEEITFLFENLIKSSQNKRKKISYYANELNISTVYLSECIRKVTGQSPKKIIFEYLILDAKTQLEKTNDTIEKIALDLGFDESSNFVLFFKKHTGVTPNKYRNSVS